MDHGFGPGIAQPVVERLRFPAERHDSLFAKLGKVLRQRRLAKLQALHQGADRQLALGKEMAQQEQPLLIGEQPKQIRGSSRLRFEVENLSIHTL